MKAKGILWKNDGRVIDDPSKKYGTGGLTKNKKYMLSVNFNAPEEAFDYNQYLSLGLENLVSNMHKANQFLGFSPIPSFKCNNVDKDTNIEKYLKDLKSHIDKHF